MARGDEGERLHEDDDNTRWQQGRFGDWVIKDVINQHRREVSFEEGQAFAKKNNLMFFETSAKTALNVEKAFLTTTQIILDNIIKGEYDLTNEVSTTPKLLLKSYISPYRALE